MMTDEKTDANYVAGNLCFLRKVMAASQEEFAKLMHMSRSCYASLESGARHVTVDDLERIRGIVKIDTDILVHRDLRRQMMMELRCAAEMPDTETFVREFLKLSERGRGIIASQIHKLREEESRIRERYEDE